jgi:hypothetical protein
MYIDNKAKRHELTDEMYELIGENQKEIVLDNGEGWLHLVGADKQEGGYATYGYDIDKNQDNNPDLVVFKVKGKDIMMKCGHIANYRTYNSVCCSACGWDKNGMNSGNKAAWEIA